MDPSFNLKTLLREVKPRFISWFISPLKKVKNRESRNSCNVNVGGVGVSSWSVSSSLSSAKIRMAAAMYDAILSYLAAARPAIWNIQKVFLGRRNGHQLQSEYEYRSSYASWIHSIGKLNVGRISVKPISKSGDCRVANSFYVFRLRAKCRKSWSGYRRYLSTRWPQYIRSCGHVRNSFLKFFISNYYVFENKEMFSKHRQKSLRKNRGTAPHTLSLLGCAPLSHQHGCQK